MLNKPISEQVKQILFEIVNAPDVTSAELLFNNLKKFVISEN